MPEDTRKSRNKVVSMFNLVLCNATEGITRTRKLCLSAAGGRVTFTLPLTVATWQQTTGCRTFLKEALLWTNQVFLITGRLEYVSLENSLFRVFCSAVWCWFTVTLTVFFKISQCSVPLLWSSIFLTTCLHACVCCQHNKCAQKQKRGGD